MKSKSQRKFTLIELLVVISIITILLTLLIPSLSRAKEHAYRASCLSNMKSLGVSSRVYAQDNRMFLFPSEKRAWVWEGVTSDIDWYNKNASSFLEGYIEKISSTVDNQFIGGVSESGSDDLSCPSQAVVSGKNVCTIGYNVYIGAYAHRMRKISLYKEPSKTMLFTDIACLGGWVEYRQPDGLINWSGETEFRHPSGMANAAFADGHADGRTITEIPIRDIFGNGATCMKQYYWNPIGPDYNVWDDGGRFVAPEYPNGYPRGSGL